MTRSDPVEINENWQDFVRQDFEGESCSRSRGYNPLAFGIDHRMADGCHGCERHPHPAKLSTGLSSLAIELADDPDRGSSHQLDSFFWAWLQG